MIISNEKYLKEAKPRVPAKSFWIKRWARIYPLYFFALAACIAFNYLVQKSIPAIPSRVGFEIIGIQRWLYGGSINFPAWSVSCEFFFYFLFPFSIPWIFKYSFNKLLLLVIVYFLITLFCNYYIFKYIPGKPTGTFINYIKNAIYFHPVFKYSIFLFGNWCGLFYLKNAYKIDAAPQYLIRIVCLFSAILIAAAIYFIPPGNFIWMQVFFVLCTQFLFGVFAVLKAGFYLFFQTRFLFF